MVITDELHQGISTNGCLTLEFSCTAQLFVQSHWLTKHHHSKWFVYSIAISPVEINGGWSHWFCGRPKQMHNYVVKAITYDVIHLNILNNTLL